ncbi:MAG: thiamine pyrophosphate-binding protein [Bacteroidales bacterium]
MLGSDILVDMLQKYGVQHIFGLPGDTGVSLYNALSCARGVTHIMCRDERHAGYMADAYTRVSESPGVCEVPSGGGVTYLLPAVAEADGSSIPMICLSSDVPVSSDEKSALTAIDQKALFSPLTRFSYRLTNPNVIPFMIRKAFRMATTGRLGPVHLAFPENVLSGKVNQKEVVQDLYIEEACIKYPAARIKPDYTLIEKTAEMLLNSERPLIIAGGGVLLSRAWKELNHLAEYASIPVATTINGKGSIAETSLLAIGVIGANGAKIATNEAVQDADVILAIGTRLNSSITMSSTLIRQAKIIQVDSDPAQLGNTVRTAVAIQGDAQIVLQDLLLAIQDRCSSSKALSNWALSIKSKIDQEFSQLANHLSNKKGNPMHPARIVQVLDDILPDTSIVVSDAGYSTPYMSAYFRIKSAGRKFIDPRAHGSLGYALPAAIGVKMAKPDATVVGLFGDGSLGMAIGELETVTRLNLPIIYIHFNNNAFGWIQNIQKIYCDENYFSTSFDPSVDYVKIASAYGLNAVRADDNDSLKKSLIEAQKSGQATFIEVSIPSGTELTPLVAPWLRDEALPEEDRKKSGY